MSIFLSAFRRHRRMQKLSAPPPEWRMPLRALLPRCLLKTPDYQVMSEEDVKRLRNNMHLAEQLGAKIETVYGEDVSYQIAEICKTFGCFKNCDRKKLRNPKEHIFQTYSYRKTDCKRTEFRMCISYPMPAAKTPHTVQKNEKKKQKCIFGIRSFKKTLPF